jgi:hypothetical protein
VAKQEKTTGKYCKTAGGKYRPCGCIPCACPPCTTARVPCCLKLALADIPNWSDCAFDTGFEETRLNWNPSQFNGVEIPMTFVPAAVNGGYCRWAGFVAYDNTGTGWTYSKCGTHGPPEGQIGVGLSAHLYYGPLPSDLETNVWVVTVGLIAFNVEDGNIWWYRYLFHQEIEDPTCGDLSAQLPLEFDENVLVRDEFDYTSELVGGSAEVTEHDDCLAINCVECCPQFDVRLETTGDVVSDVIHHVAFVGEGLPGFVCAWVDAGTTPDDDENFSVRVTLNRGGFGIPIWVMTITYDDGVDSGYWVYTLPVTGPGSSPCPTAGGWTFAESESEPVEGIDVSFTISNPCGDCPGCDEEDCDPDCDWLPDCLEFRFSGPDTTSVICMTRTGCVWTGTATGVWTATLEIGPDEDGDCVLSFELTDGNCTYAFDLDWHQAWLAMSGAIDPTFPLTPIEASCVSGDPALIVPLRLKPCPSLLPQPRCGLCNDCGDNPMEWILTFDAVYKFVCEALEVGGIRYDQDVQINADDVGFIRLRPGNVTIEGSDLSGCLWSAVLDVSWRRYSGEDDDCDNDPEGEVEDHTQVLIILTRDTADYHLIATALGFFTNNVFEATTAVDDDSDCFQPVSFTNELTTPDAYGYGGTADAIPVEPPII